MSKPFQAIFESGVLKPLEPVSLGEHEIVTLVIARRDDTPAASERLRDDFVDHELMAIAQREGEGAIPLEELRERLKSIRGSMSDVVISERGECRVRSFAVGHCRVRLGLWCQGSLWRT